jgi:hypothetical protein
MKKIIPAIAALFLLIAPALASTDGTEDWYTWYENQKSAQDGQAAPEEHAQGGGEAASGQPAESYVASADAQPQSYQQDQYAAVPPQQQDQTYQNDAGQEPGYVGGSDEPQAAQPEQPAAADDSEWIWAEASDGVTQ